MYVAIVNYDRENRVTKYQNYKTKSEADAHVARVIGEFQRAFVVKSPGGSVSTWLVNPDAKTISISPHVETEKEKQFKLDVEIDVKRMKEAVLNVTLSWASLENHMAFLLENIISKSNYQLGFVIYFAVASADARFKIVDKSIVSMFQQSSHSKRLITAWETAYKKTKAVKENRNHITHGQIIPTQKKRYGKQYVRLTKPLFSPQSVAERNSRQLPGMSIRDVETTIKDIELCSSRIVHFSMIAAHINSNNESELMDKLHELEAHLQRSSLSKKV